MKVSGISTIANSYNAKRIQKRDSQAGEKNSAVSFKAVPKHYDKGLLIILDGFGIREKGNLNPFTGVRIPFWKSLWNNSWGDTLVRKIEASGVHVGLPAKLAGSSEVGHNNLGAGRLIPQDLMVIDRAIDDGSFKKNEAFLDAMNHAKENNSTLHLMTLLSDGFVHSSTRHLHELIKMANENGVKDVKVHAFLDGRDVAEGTSKDYLNNTNKILNENGYSNVASFIGMKYPMDRSRDWDKTGKAYDLLVNGKSDYDAHEFEGIWNDLHETKHIREKDIPAVKLEGFKPIQDNDAVIFTNYRNDRTRQLTDAITQPSCTAPFLKGQKRLQNLNFVCMTEYDPSYHLPEAFPAEVHSNTLTEVLNDQKYRPFVAAETEKQAHMTFFFDGKRHIRYSDTSYFFPASDHETLLPEMQGKTIRDLITSWMHNQKSKAMLVNFANADMIGHDQDIRKGMKTLEYLDVTLKKIIEEARKNNIATIITADHGNIEDFTHGGHTNNPVPFVAVLPNSEKYIESGKLFLDDASDAAISRVAPSFLDLLKGAKKPDEMYDSLFKMKK
ncbi:phosphoglycerate mutase (2,3-diphosphoglycerate-independent) [bacterium]|nr:phosphoglycerate mutase (2,3-diphosphoglycerate-independent) [bacterium]